jgi:hypothetical protein
MVSSLLKIEIENRLNDSAEVQIYCAHDNNNGGFDFKRCVITAFDGKFIRVTYPIKIDCFKSGSRTTILDINSITLIESECLIEQVGFIDLQKKDK